MRCSPLLIIMIVVLITVAITVLLKFAVTQGDDYCYVKRGEQDCFCWDRMGTSGVNWR
jgi:hypothetical protein